MKELETICNPIIAKMDEVMSKESTSITIGYIMAIVLRRATPPLSCMMLTISDTMITTPPTSH
jgi:hypothetical protein